MKDLIIVEFKMQDKKLPRLKQALIMRQFVKDYRLTMDTDKFVICLLGDFSGAIHIETNDPQFIFDFAWKFLRSENVT